MKTKCSSLLDLQLASNARFSTLHLINPSDLEKKSQLISFRSPKKKWFMAPPRKAFALGRSIGIGSFIRFVNSVDYILDLVNENPVPKVANGSLAR